MADLELGWLSTLKAALTAAGIRHAVDPADLNTPGVLIKPTGFALDLLDGATATADLFAVVDNNPHDQALAELVALGNKLLEVVDAAGAVRLASVQLPDSGGRLPALLIPYDDTYTRTDTP